MKRRKPEIIRALIRGIKFKVRKIRLKISAKIWLKTGRWGFRNNIRNDIRNINRRSLLWKHKYRFP